MSIEKSQKWTDQQLKYISFVARGKETISGEKRTDEQFAKAIGVDRRTLWRWRKLPGFRQLVFEEMLDENLPHVRNVLKSQTAASIKKGKGGDASSATLVMKAYGMLTDRFDHTTMGKEMPAPILDVRAKDV